MNGLYFIREKSNISQSLLAEIIGVSRQSIHMWESGIRKPGAKHLHKLSEFYGIDPEYFGELNENKLSSVKERDMYFHWLGDHEYCTFVPEGDPDMQLSISCGSCENMLDIRYKKVNKREKDCIRRVEEYLRPEKFTYLMDRIITAERGIADIERYLELMNVIRKVGNKRATRYKVPLRYEIKTVIYAMMIAYGLYTKEELKETNDQDFITDCGVYVDEEYMDELIEIMRKHWEKTIG